MRETGNKDALHTHFASMRPLIESLMAQELQLSTLSNTKFYKKLQPEICGAFESSQPQGIASRRFFQEPVGHRRGTSFTWSEARPEEKCRRPYLNMEPLRPSDPAQLAVIKKRLQECLERWPALFAIDVQSSRGVVALKAIEEFNLRWRPCAESAGLSAGVLAIVAAPTQPTGARTTEALLSPAQAPGTTPTASPSPTATTADAVERRTDGSASEPSTSTAAGMSRKKKPTQARTKRNQPLHQLTQQEVNDFYAKRSTDADWLLQNTNWIRQDRDVRLRAMTEWAQFNDKASLAVTYFLALEKDAQMRAAHNGGADTFTARSGMDSQLTSPPPASAAAAAANDAANDATTAASTKAPASAASASERPSTPPPDAIRDLLAIGKDLAGSRQKRKLSPNSTKAEDARLVKTMRQLAGQDETARDLARGRIGFAQNVLSQYGVPDNVEQDKLRANMAMGALGTPEC